LRTPLLLSILLSLAPVARADSSWPVNLDGVLSAEGACDANVLREVDHTGKAGEDTILKSVVRASGDEACRLVKLKKIFLESPAKVCPGVVAASFAGCYSSILEALDKRNAPSLSGHILLMSFAVMYAVQIKTSTGDADLAQGILFDTTIATLKSVGQHTPLTALPRTVQAKTPAEREYIALLDRVDTVTTRQFVEATLARITRAPIPSYRAPASQTTPPRAKEIVALVKRWHFPDPKLKHDVDGLKRDLKKHPDIPFN
jgi:hypothetical protein